MPHTSKNPTLGRKAAPRKALLVSQSNSLLRHKRIITTLVKTKALARYVAPIITHARTHAKRDVNHAYRHAFASLRDKKVVQMLFTEILPAIKERQGGYTRIVKMGKRKGDNAKMALIELVDFNKLFQKTRKIKTRRSRKKRGEQTLKQETPSLNEATKDKKKQTKSDEKK